MPTRNLQVYSRYSSLIDSNLVDGGSMDIPTNITVNGLVHELTTSVANGANAVVYNDELSSFNFLYLSSSYNTRALITDTASNTFSINLRGTNEGSNNNVRLGVALQLGSDKTADANTSINSIQVFNTSGNTASVRCVAIQ